LWLWLWLLRIAAMDLAHFPAEFRAIKQTEDEYRRLYAQDPRNARLDNPDVLVNVFHNVASFAIVQPTRINPVRPSHYNLNAPMTCMQAPML
jgi:hypothetical protein